jgi:polygalacturonase
MANVRDFGARGDGQTDDTAALAHAIQQGDGCLVFPRGDYLISRPLHVPLEVHGRAGIEGQGGTARLIMTGPGPALHLVGSHRRNALPANVAEAVWQRERLPTVGGLEILGRHPEADGIRIEGVMQPTLLGLLIRRCRHGVHLVKLDRNVLIADCHIYDNSGVGVFLEGLNLHQVIVHGSHISYCKQGGIQIVRSEIRNLQICSNDIEYNHDDQAASSADILFDCREGTVREGTIAGNTIQAVPTPGGANIRLIGMGKGKNTAVGMLAISGNLIGSQQASVHLQSCRGVTLSGNCLYHGAHYSILAEDSDNLVLGPNSIDHNPDYKGKSTDAIRLHGCRNVTMTGLILEHSGDGAIEPPASVEISNCRDISLTGCHIVGARKRGVRVGGSMVVRIADSTIRAREGDKDFESSVSVAAGSGQVLVVNNFLARGSAGSVVIPAEAGSVAGNVAL